MAKFKMHFKLTGLEFDIEGEKDSLPQAAKAIGQQLGGLLSAPAMLSTGTDSPPPTGRIIEMNDPAPAKRKSSRSKSSSGEKVAAEALDFRHDPEQWGNPSQSWKTLEKSIWLLLVTEQMASTKEMSGTVIAATFNKHFRQAKEIQAGNVNRDLGVAKNKAASLVGEDTSKQPSAWYLTDAGKKAAQQLVQQAKSGAAA